MRRPRAATSLALTKAKAEEESKKQSDTSVRDPESATNFLLAGEFKCEDDEMTLELLSIIAMQLLQQHRTPKMALEAFKAISYLIFDLQQNQVIADTTDIIAKSVSVAMKRIHDELVEATKNLVSAMAESNKAGELLQIGCHSTIHRCSHNLCWYLSSCQCSL